jgi:hypothetical protein
MLTFSIIEIKKTSNVFKNRQQEQIFFLWHHLSTYQKEH